MRYEYKYNKYVKKYNNLSKMNGSRFFDYFKKKPEEEKLIKNTELYNLIKNDDVNGVKELLEKYKSDNVLEKHINSYYDFDFANYFKNLWDGKIQRIEKYHIHESLSPLSHAVDLKYYDIIKLLLKYGSKPVFDYGNAEAPLISSINDGNVKRKYKIMKLLIKYGADVNEKYSRYTPLQYESTMTNKNIIIYKLLVENGANINDINPKEDKTAITLSLPHIYGYDENDPVSSHEINNTLDIIKYLIDNGAKLNNKDFEEKYKPWPPLYHAVVFSRNYKIVKLLIDRGADVNVNDEYFYILHDAIEDRISYKIIKLLIDSGADVYAFNDINKTPLNIVNDIEDNDSYRNKVRKLITDKIKSKKSKK